MKMTKISNINFSNKTIENVEVISDDIKEIKFEFLDNIFKITIMKDDGKEVIEVFEEEQKETVEKEVVADDVIEEPVNKQLTIAEVKKMIYENIPKKNTAET